MEWIIITGIIAVLIFAIAVFRGDIKGRRIQHDIDRARRISTGLGKIGESNQRTEEGLDKLGDVNKLSQKRTDDIGRHNKSAKDRIRSVIDILKNAKNRKPNP